MLSDHNYWKRNFIFNLLCGRRTVFYDQMWIDIALTLAAAINCGLITAGEPVMRSLSSSRSAAAPGSAGAAARVVPGQSNEPAQLQCDPGTRLHVVGLTPLGGTESNPSPVVIEPGKGCKYLDDVKKRIVKKCNGLEQCVVDMSEIQATKDHCVKVKFVSIDVYCQPMRGGKSKSKKFNKSMTRNRFVKKKLRTRKKLDKTRNLSKTSKKFTTSSKRRGGRRRHGYGKAVRAGMRKNSQSHKKRNEVGADNKAEMTKLPLVHCRKSVDGSSRIFMCRHKGRLPQSMLDAIKDDSYIIVTGAKSKKKKLVIIQREGRTLTRDILLNILNSNDIIRHLKASLKPNSMKSRRKSSSIKSFKSLNKANVKKSKKRKGKQFRKKRRRKYKHRNASGKHSRRKGRKKQKTRKNSKHLKKRRKFLRAAKKKILHASPTKTVTLEIKLAVNEKRGRRINKQIAPLSSVTVSNRKKHSRRKSKKVVRLKGRGTNKKNDVHSPFRNKKKPSHPKSKKVVSPKGYGSSKKITPNFSFRKAKKYSRRRGKKVPRLKGHGINKTLSTHSSFRNMKNNSRRKGKKAVRLKDQKAASKRNRKGTLKSFSERHKNVATRQQIPTSKPKLAKHNFSDIVYVKSYRTKTYSRIKRVRRSRQEQYQKDSNTGLEAFLGPASITYSSPPSKIKRKEALKILHSSKRRPNFKLDFVSEDNSTRQPTKSSQAGINARVSLTNADLQQLFDSLDYSENHVVSATGQSHHTAHDNKPVITISIHIGSLFPDDHKFTDPVKNKLIQRMFKSENEFKQVNNQLNSSKTVARKVTEGKNQRTATILKLLPGNFNGRMNEMELRGVMTNIEARKSKPTSTVKILFLLYLIKKLGTNGSKILIDNGGHLPPSMRHELEMTRMLPLLNSHAITNRLINGKPKDGSTLQESIILKQNSGKIDYGSNRWQNISKAKSKSSERKDENDIVFDHKNTTLHAENHDDSNKNRNKIGIIGKKKLDRTDVAPGRELVANMSSARPTHRKGSKKLVIGSMKKTYRTGVGQESMSGKFDETTNSISSVADKQPIKTRRKDSKKHNLGAKNISQHEGVGPESISSVSGKKTHQTHRKSSKKHGSKSGEKVSVGSKSISSVSGDKPYEATTKGSTKQGSFGKKTAAHKGTEHEAISSISGEKPYKTQRKDSKKHSLGAKKMNQYEGVGPESISSVYGKKTHQTHRKSSKKHGSKSGEKVSVGSKSISSVSGDKPYEATTKGSIKQGSFGKKTAAHKGTEHEAISSISGEKPYKTQRKDSKKHSLGAKKMNQYEGVGPESISSVYGKKTHQTHRKSSKKHGSKSGEKVSVGSKSISSVSGDKPYEATTKGSTKQGSFGKKTAAHKGTEHEAISSISGEKPYKTQRKDSKKHSLGAKKMNQYEGVGPESISSVYGKKTHQTHRKSSKKHGSKSGEKVSVGSKSISSVSGDKPYEATTKGSTKQGSFGKKTAAHKGTEHEAISSISGEKPYKTQRKDSKKHSLGVKKISQHGGVRPESISSESGGKSYKALRKGSDKHGVQGEKVHQHGEKLSKVHKLDDSLTSSGLLVDSLVTAHMKKKMEDGRLNKSQKVNKQRHKNKLSGEVNQNKSKSQQKKIKVSQQELEKPSNSTNKKHTKMVSTLERPESKLHEHSDKSKYDQTVGVHEEKATRISDSSLVSKPKDKKLSHIKSLASVKLTDRKTLNIINKDRVSKLQGSSFPGTELGLSLAHKASEGRKIHTVIPADSNLVGKQKIDKFRGNNALKQDNFVSKKMNALSQGSVSASHQPKLSQSKLYNRSEPLSKSKVVELVSEISKSSNSSKMENLIPFVKNTNKKIEGYESKTPEAKLHEGKVGGSKLNRLSMPKASIPFENERAKSFKAKKVNATDKNELIHSHLKQLNNEKPKEGSSKKISHKTVPNTTYVGLPDSNESKTSQGKVTSTKNTNQTAIHHISELKSLNFPAKTLNNSIGLAKSGEKFEGHALKLYTKTSAVKPSKLSPRMEHRVKPELKTGKSDEVLKLSADSAGEAPSLKASVKKIPYGMKDIEKPPAMTELSVHRLGKPHTAHTNGVQAGKLNSVSYFNTIRGDHKQEASKSSSTGMVQTQIGALKNDDALQLKSQGMPKSKGTEQSFASLTSLGTNQERFNGTERHEGSSSISRGSKKDGKMASESSLAPSKPITNAKEEKLGTSVVKQNHDGLKSSVRSSLLELSSPASKNTKNVAVDRTKEADGKVSKVELPVSEISKKQRLQIKESSTMQNASAVPAFNVNKAKSELNLKSNLSVIKEGKDSQLRRTESKLLTVEEMKSKSKARAKTASALGSTSFVSGKQNERKLEIASSMPLLKGKKESLAQSAENKVPVGKMEKHERVDSQGHSSHSDSSASTGIAKDSIKLAKASIPPGFLTSPGQNSDVQEGKIAAKLVQSKTENESELLKVDNKVAEQSSNRVHVNESPKISSLPVSPVRKNNDEKKPNVIAESLSIPVRKEGSQSLKLDSSSKGGTQIQSTKTGTAIKQTAPDLSDIARKDDQMKSSKLALKASHEAEAASSVPVPGAEKQMLDGKGNVLAISSNRQIESRVGVDSSSSHDNSKQLKLAAVEKKSGASTESLSKLGRMNEKSLGRMDEKSKPVEIKLADGEKVNDVTTSLKPSLSKSSVVAADKKPLTTYDKSHTPNEVGKQLVVKTGSEESTLLSSHRTPVDSRVNPGIKVGHLGEVLGSPVDSRMPTGKSGEVPGSAVDSRMITGKSSEVPGSTVDSRIKPGKSGVVPDSPREPTSKITQNQQLEAVKWNEPAVVNAAKFPAAETKRPTRLPALTAEHTIAPVQKTKTPTKKSGKKTLPSELNSDRLLRDIGVLHSSDSAIAKSFVPVATQNDQCAIANLCHNFGTCQTSTGGVPVCICRRGFSGPTCETAVNPCLPNPCLNDANCTVALTLVISNAGKDAIDFMCKCASGFSGRRCEIQLNPCDSRPCLHGGRCSLVDKPTVAIDSGALFRCQCANDFVGPLCEIQLRPSLTSSSLSPPSGCSAMDPDQCMNGGTCRISSSSSEDQSHCRCSVGFLGRRCEIKAIQCADQSLCLNGGTCQQAPGAERSSSPYFLRCLCPSRFVGRLCEKIRQRPIQGCHLNPCSIADASATCREVDDRGTGGSGFLCSCSPGRRGELCEIAGDPCGLLDANRSNPCRNSGMCLPLPGIGLYRCLCSSHYVGRHCDIAVVRCATTICLNGGVCSSTDPSSSASFHSIDSHGPDIGTSVCRCPVGYVGRHCESHADPCRRGPCNNGGLCRPANNHDGFACICAEPFFGSRCELTPNRTSSKSDDSGNSEQKSQSDKVSPKTETLIVNMRGNGDCGTASFCLNGGSCFRTTGGRHVCVCPRSFGGERCENGRDSCSSNPCLNGASCFNSPTATFRCVCTAGYTGSRCDVGPTICAGNTPPCRNNGVCRPARNTAGYECICPLGYGGLACELRDPCLGRPCRNGAECSILPATDLIPSSVGISTGLISYFQCLCPAGFGGQRCEINGTAHMASLERTACSSVPCRSGATCRLSTSRDGFACVCPPGVKGKRCERDSKNDCRRAPCRHGGVCFDRPGGFECSCPDGYRGITCEVKLFGDPCDSHPCSNGGRCKMINVESFSCHCPALFSGTHCTERRKLCESGQLQDPCSEHQICAEDPADFDMGFICVDKTLQTQAGVYQWKFVHHAGSDDDLGIETAMNDAAEEKIRGVADENTRYKKKLSATRHIGSKEVAATGEPRKSSNLGKVFGYGVLLSASLLAFILIFFIIWDKFRPPVDDYGSGSKGYKSLPTNGSTPTSSRPQTPQPASTRREPRPEDNFQQSNSWIGDLKTAGKSSSTSGSSMPVMKLPAAFIQPPPQRGRAQRKSSTSFLLRTRSLASIPEETDFRNARKTLANNSETKVVHLEPGETENTIQIGYEITSDDVNVGDTLPASDIRGSDVEVTGCKSEIWTANIDDCLPPSGADDANNSSTGNKNNSSAPGISLRDLVLARLSDAANNRSTQSWFTSLPTGLVHRTTEFLAVHWPSTTIIEPTLTTGSYLGLETHLPPPIVLDTEGFQAVELFCTADDRYTIMSPSYSDRRQRHRVGPFNYAVSGTR